MATVKFNMPISGMLIFSGCLAGPQKVCDVKAEFTVQEPGGKLVPGGQGPVWVAPPPRTGELMIGQASVTVNMGHHDSCSSKALRASVIRTN